jgi:hypothetical protein
VAEVFAQVAEAPDETAAEARAAEIERSGLAEVDPDLPARLAELEAVAAEGFATFLAEAPPFPEASGEPSADGSADADGSPEPSPEAGTSGTAFLAARLPGPRGDRRFAQGGSYLSSIGEILGFASREVSGFKPSKGSGRSSADPHESGGSRYRIDQAFDRDTLTLIIERTEQYTVPGATADAPAYTVTDTGGTTLQVDTCPDEDGTIVVTANASGTYDVVGEGLSYHATLDTNDRATATVNDDAELAGRSHALTVRGSATGDRPAFAGGEGAVDSQLDASLTWDGATAAGTTPEVTLNTADGVDVRDLRSAFTGGAFTSALVDAAIDAAEVVWQDGRCLELDVEPPGKEVESGSQTTITVKIMHKAFDEEVRRDVTSTLEGTEEVAPLDAPVRAPAEFTYTATSAVQGEGTITFRSVSNRGIAQERSETYTVNQRLLLDVNGRVTFRQPGVLARGTMKGRGLKVSLVPGDDPDAPPGVKVEGSATLEVRATSPGCEGRGRKRFPVDSALNASARVIGTGDDRQLEVLLRPGDPNAELRIDIRCPRNASVHIAFPLTRMWPSFERGGEIVLPLSGGTAERRANISGARSVFTYTLRKERAR